MNITFNIIQSFNLFKIIIWCFNPVSSAVKYLKGKPLRERRSAAYSGSLTCPPQDLQASIHWLLMFYLLFHPPCHLPLLKAFSMSSRFHSLWKHLRQPFLSLPLTATYLSYLSIWQKTVLHAFIFLLQCLFYWFGGQFSPQKYLHKVHHSKLRPESNQKSNYSANIDRIFLCSGRIWAWKG